MNLAALETLRQLQYQHRVATEAERAVLRKWSGWGALPAVFDANAASYEKYHSIRVRLDELLSAEEIAAARRSTLNAHYTDPAYVAAIWTAVQELGFRDGRVLEPGCGSGNFIAGAPPRAELVGVELDPTTAAIAAALHPAARVLCESFGDSRFSESSFDLMVGNVPFGDIVLHDRRHNALRHSIHNHFIIKGLHLVKPGGLVAVITSRYTLDSANPAARREMSSLADLVGAVRLPTGAHRSVAGTDVVTDLLLFRRREPDRRISGASFERSQQLPGAVESLSVNEYFLSNPAHALGTMRATQGEGGRPELEVVGDRAARSQLATALSQIVSIGRAAGLGYAAGGIAGEEQRKPLAFATNEKQKPEGYLAYGVVDGTFTRIEAGAEVPHALPQSQARELRALLELRDTVVALLEGEADTNEDGPVLESIRQRLNTSYASYVAAYGPINRFTERATGFVDPATGERKRARIRPKQGGFRTDPFANAVYALEHFDSATQTATKAAIFRERVLVHRPQRLGADTPEDALAICVDKFGEVRLDEVARLLGTDTSRARQKLATLVFDEPDSTRLVPAAEYLSGNVRQKLKAAELAMMDDERYAPNVAALVAVQPRDLAPDEISAQLGAAWIDRRYVEQFLRETLEDPTLTVDHPGAALWTVQSRVAKSVQTTSQWGTERYPAPQIAQALLEQRPIRIYDEGPLGERRFNAEATDAAMEKANELAERFSEWVWQQPERAAVLTRTYNERFNAIVPRSYDGVSLSLPGLTLSFKPRQHQIAAVARIIQEPGVGLFHEVGAGKTAEMVMGSMELKRLGFANKPAVVVPNHMLEQFTREWLQMYPQARILTASREDLDRERRRLFQAKCATGEWDGIVMTRSAFERVPMSPDAQKRYLEREVSAIDAMLENAKNSRSSLTLKRVEKIKARFQERLKEKLDAVKDPGLSFEMLGIDYVFVDEAHAYKNLRTASNIPGMSVDGSMRATDLHMKLEFLRERRARVATLATATPIANSIGEAFTMQRYLRPDLLEQAGIGEFDQWAATFGRTLTAIEVAADGTGLRVQTRFASFRNVPELLQLWQVSADIKTAEDLRLPVPALRQRHSDGQRAPEVVVIQPSVTLKEFVELLAERADRVRGRGVDPSVDNLLKIASDGRAAGLDLRLLGLRTADEQKVEVAAARIAGIYHKHRNDSFPGFDGSPHPRPGALQLVFCDLGTPKDDVWNVYDELRRQLVERGVPRSEVRFMHEARDDREKGELFAACRAGRVAVLVGSTERMGVGTNVQLRAVALHHLDCPWRPADLAQREGRILRQGNANEEIEILRYVTEGSFDGYLWQTVARKATFIAQVMRGRLDVREIEDIGDAALSYNEVKALAAGNPLLLEHARVQAEVTRLERLERAYANKRNSLRWSLGRSEEVIERKRAEIPLCDSALARLSAHQASGEGGFQMEVQGTSCKQGDGNRALRQALMEFAVHSTRRRRQGQSHPPTIIGTVYDFHIRATPGMLDGNVICELVDVPEAAVTLGPSELPSCLPLTRLERRLAELPTWRRNAEWEICRHETESVRAREELDKPFRHSELLRKVRAELNELTAQLQSHLTASAPTEHHQGDIVATASDASCEERWQRALEDERASITRRAAALGAKIADRVGQLERQLHAQRCAAPRPPGLFGLGGQPYKSWERHLEALEARRGELLAAAHRLREYLDPTPEAVQSKCHALAVRRLTRSNPELTLAVECYRREHLRRTQGGARLDRRGRSV